MDVVAIQASPRPRGHSTRLLEQLLEPLDGCSILRIGPSELLVDPCRSCGACLESGRCPTAAPRLQEHMELLWQARIVVLASPVYFLGPPGPLKLFMDRMQPLWARTYRLSRRRPRSARALALLTAAGSNAAFRHFDALLSAWFHSLGIRNTAFEHFPYLELDTPLPSDYLRRARGRGESLADWLAASLRAKGT